MKSLLTIKKSLLVIGMVAIVLLVGIATLILSSSFGNVAFAGSITKKIIDEKQLYNGSTYNLYVDLFITNAYSDDSDYVNSNTVNFTFIRNTSKSNGNFSISNLKFNIYDSNNNLVDTISIGSLDDSTIRNGKTFSKEINDGSYYLKMTGTSKRGSYTEDFDIQSSSFRVDGQSPQFNKFGVDTHGSIWFWNWTTYTIPDDKIYFNENFYISVEDVGSEIKSLGYVVIDYADSDNILIEEKSDDNFLYCPIDKINGLYFFTATDTVGNNSYFYLYYDDISPEINCSIADGGYTSSSFKVEGTDSGTGCDNLFYKAPGSSSFVSVGGISKTISSSSENGWYRFYSVDKAGNKSKNYSVYLDTKSPTVTGTVSNSTYTATEFTITAADTTYAEYSLYMKAPGSSSYSSTNSNSKTIPTGSPVGWYYFYAKDYSERESAIYKVYYDNEKPNITSAIPNSVDA